MEEDYKTTDLGSSNEQYRGVPYQLEYMTQPINPFSSSQPFSAEWNRKFTRSALEAKQDEEQSKIETLITQGYLPEIYKGMTLPPSMLNDLWNKFEQDQAYKSGQPQLRTGLSDAELERNRQQREQAVRMNQLTNGFFLNMYGSNPVSDRYAYENPSLINQRFAQNARIAYGVALAPFMGGAFGNSAAGTMFGLSQGFMPFDQLFGTFRRGFQYGANDAVDAWVNGNSGFFNEDWASQNPRTALLGNLLGDIYAGKAVNGASRAVSDVRTMWNNAANEARNKVALEVRQDVAPSPYNGLEITGPTKAIEARPQRAITSTSEAPKALPAPEVKVTPIKYSLEEGNVPNFEYNPDISYSEMLGIDKGYEDAIRFGLERPLVNTAEATSRVEAIKQSAIDQLNNYIRKTFGDHEALTPEGTEAVMDVRPYNTGSTTEYMQKIFGNMDESNPILVTDHSPNNESQSYLLTKQIIAEQAKKMAEETALASAEGRTPRKIPQLELDEERVNPNGEPVRKIDPLSMQFYRGVIRKLATEPIRGLDTGSGEYSALPLSNFIARVKSLSIPDIEKWKMIRDYVKTPQIFYKPSADGPLNLNYDYSTDSYPMVLGNLERPKRMHVEPANFSHIELLNGFGQNSDNWQMFRVDGKFKPSEEVLSTNPMWAPFVRQAKLGFPYFYNYPIATFKKKGGKLIKQYF